MAHTPGPWVWTGWKGHGGYVTGVLRGAFGDSPATYPIINSPGTIDGPTVELDVDNARLIAAAPDLLEALENAMGQIDTPIARRKLGIDPHSDWLRHARESLKSAKGETE